MVSARGLASYCRRSLVRASARLVVGPAEIDIDILPRAARRGLAYTQRFGYVAIGGLVQPQMPRRRWPEV